MRVFLCNKSPRFSGTALFVLLFCIGCGGSGSGSGSPPAVSLTAPQATAIATQLNTNFIASTAAIGSNLCPTIGLKIGQEAFCTVAVASSGPCTGGGTASLTGVASGNMDFTDSGGTTAVLTEVPAACAVSGTDLTVTGEPGIAIDGTLNFFYGGIDYVNVTQVGSVKYGPSPSGSCAVSLTTTASFEGNAAHTVQSCAVTGTACGQAINQSCM